MNRRSFLKTAGMLSAPLISLSPSVLEASPIFPVGPAEPAEKKASSSDSWTLSNREQRIVVARHQGLISYQSFVRDEKDEWKAGSLASNAFVTGPSFQFAGISPPGSGASETSVLKLEGTGQGRNRAGAATTYKWKTEISNPQGSPWFRFRTTLHLPEGMRLQQVETLEPQIILWLNSTSTMMEGQSASWRRILLDQPTRNSLGAPGNDLPAVYLQDANNGIETMMYFDLSEMSWMSLDNIPRFLGYRCATVSVLEHGGNQRLGIGLIAQQAAGDVLPAGEVSFVYSLLQRRCESLITEQEAVKRWMETLLPLFEEKLEWPKSATSWNEFAAGTVRDVQQKDVALISVKGHAGLRAYVKASSGLWKEAGDNFELMTMADVLWPSLLYLKVHPDAAYQQVVNDLLESLPIFCHEDTQSISNDFVRGKNETADSWYPFENSLIKYPVIGALSGSKTLTGNFIKAYDTAIRIAHRYDYLFPVYYRTDSLEQRGAGTNYAVGGLYAWGGLIAHRLTGDAKYRDEARRAVEVLMTLRASSLFHEPQELAFGALAATELEMQDAAHYLLYEQLRMFYWYSDPSQKTHDIRGMVQACASVLYPAFKENVEAILPWTGIMKRGVMIEALLRFMDQQRRNNFYYFENRNVTPGKQGLMPYIPYENLGILELGGRTGVVGKEIYGSGEVLWLYLMFEALGAVSDRELMLVNLDLLDAFDSSKFPPRELNFILFNPTNSERSAEVSVPVARSAPVRLTVEGEPATGTFRVGPGRHVLLKAGY